MMRARGALWTAVAAVTLSAGAAAQDKQHIVELGAVAMLAWDQGVYQGMEYDQRAPLFGGRGSLRLGPLFARGTCLMGTLPEQQLGATGFLPDRDVTMWDGTVGILPVAWLRLEGSLWYREYDSNLGTQRWAGFGAGIGLQGALMPDLLQARLSVHYVPDARSSVFGEDLDLGWNGEVEVALQPRRVPFRLTVGYRLERLDTHRSGAEDFVDRQMRLSGVMLGAQVAF